MEQELPINAQALERAYEVQKAHARAILKGDSYAKFALVHDLESFPGYGLVCLVTQDDQIIAMILEAERVENALAELRVVAEKNT